MSVRARAGRDLVVGAAILVLATTTACAWLAQSDLFAALRPQLIEDCCTCLARRGTPSQVATCTEAIVVDGVTTIPDAGPVGDPSPGGEPLNDTVDDGEVPCLCSGDRNTCIAALTEGTAIVIPGACVEDDTTDPPCASACSGVLGFDPLPVR